MTVLAMVASLLSGLGLGWMGCLWWRRDRRPTWARPLHNDAICGRCGAARGGHAGYSVACRTTPPGFFRPMSPEQRLSWEMGEDIFKPQARA